MQAALKDAITEQLRPEGFTGSLPHLRRRSAARIDLISFQFHSAGGSFVVEVAACGPTGFTTSWGTHLEPTKVRAQDIPSPRPRLGSPSFPAHGDHWFVFGPRNDDRRAGRLKSLAHYEAIAAEVIQLIRDDAEPFWRSVPLPP